MRFFIEKHDLCFFDRKRQPLVLSLYLISFFCDVALLAHTPKRKPRHRSDLGFGGRVRCLGFVRVLVSVRSSSRVFESKGDRGVVHSSRVNKHFRQTKKNHPTLMDGNKPPLSLCTAAIESQKFGIHIPRTRLPQQKRVDLETTRKALWPNG